MKYLRFAQDFKQFLSEQFLSETVTPPEFCRRYHIPSGLLYPWKRHYAQRRPDPQRSKEAELAARLQEMERLCGKTALENELLRKASRNSLKQTEKRRFITENCTLGKRLSL